MQTLMLEVGQTISFDIKPINKGGQPVTVPTLHVRRIHAIGHEEVAQVTQVAGALVITALAPGLGIFAVGHPNIDGEQAAEFITVEVEANAHLLGLSLPLRNAIETMDELKKDIQSTIPAEPTNG